MSQAYGKWRLDSCAAITRASYLPLVLRRGLWAPIVRGGGVVRGEGMEVGMRPMMSIAMRVLLAVDESENSHRVVRYVGSLLGRTPDVVVTLFHVLKPMPRGLLEHGGSENPAAEAQLSVQLRNEQEGWIRKERESECHVLKQACEMLEQSGFDMSHVEVKYGHEDDIARNILEEARSGHHETIVVGRQGTSRIKQIFGGGVTDHLLRDAKGFAIWVVE
jgi:nucleotide-binding universal stress UspA family protein